MAGRCLMSACFSHGSLEPRHRHIRSTCYAQLITKLNHSVFIYNSDFPPQARCLPSKHFYPLAGGGLGEGGVGRGVQFHFGINAKKEKSF